MIGVSVSDTTLGTLVANLGYDQLRFPNPVFAGDTLRVESECIGVRDSKSRPNAGIVTWAHRSFNQRDELVCECTRTALLLKKPAMTRRREPRSWLFVPADSEKKIAKAIESEADAMIFDLEDSVAPAQKAAAREILKGLPQALRRTAMVGARQPDRKRTPQGRPAAVPQIGPSRHRPAQGRKRRRRRSSSPTAPATSRSTPSSPRPRPACSACCSYRDPASPLAAMSWGAEDLSAALGAASKYDADGSLSFTYRLARSLCLAGAVAAGVQPVDGVFADFKDEKGLQAEAEAARREGFTGKLAIHPAQVPVINAAFTPSGRRNPPRRRNRRRVRGTARRGRAIGRRQDGRSAAPRAGQTHIGTSTIGGLHGDDS